MKRGTWSTPAHRLRTKQTVSWWKKEAWKVFSRWIRTRDKWTCYTCGKCMPNSPAMHGGHFISRRINATMFDEMNVHAQCMFCNMYDYGATGPYADRLMRDYGVPAFKALLARSKQTKQFTIPELQAIIQKYAL